MQAGFAMCEAGLTRAKNTGNILMKNMMDFCIRNSRNSGWSESAWMFGGERCFTAEKLDPLNLRKLSVLDLCRPGRFVILSGRVVSVQTSAADRFSGFHGRADKFPKAY